MRGDIPICLSPMIAFWHQPHAWIDPHREWHAYDTLGNSLCGHLFIGEAPDDATMKPPAESRCRACAARSSVRTAATSTEVQ